MNIAISNIAWRRDEEGEAAKLLQRMGIQGVEVAPSKIGPEPALLGDDEIRRYRAFWNELGIEIVSMQALLFGQDHLALFHSDAERDEMLRYLERIIRIGGALGAKALVFGSPKNRRKGPLSDAEARAIAVPFFRAAGKIAAEFNTCLCIEPNPPVYGCDWITSASAALELVDEVDQPGFGLHLDAAALHLAGEGPDTIRRCGAKIRHFHASQPQLVAVRAGGEVDHATFADTLRELEYERWVSIEMREQPAGESNLAAAGAALEFACHVYGA